MSGNPTLSPLAASWHHVGVVIPRQREGYGTSVVGDPCIVWDATIPGWRMVFFMDPPGTGQAICRDLVQVGPGSWEIVGPLPFTNTIALLGGFTHKPLS
jgi:hypothetical protein